ncbi:MAG: hydrogenase formation protein HypD [Candidatus Binatia bacterium]
MYSEPYRAPVLVQRLLTEIRDRQTRAWTIMEVCGGQTHSILRYGLDQLLPAEITIVHGPGCPVCVTPVELIDAAISLATREGVILGSFGDMLRVPGSHADLFAARAIGGDVRVVYSPLDALHLAQRHPERQVVFFAVGFETTAPTTAMAVWQARQLGLPNFSLLTAHVRVPPAIEAILSSPHNRVQGFLAAGHVCTVMGVEEYEALVQRYSVPIVVTGFEPVDLLRGIRSCVEQLEAKQARVDNQYTRAVRREGNVAARARIHEVFTPVDRRWRGIGVLPQSGLALRETYADYDAEKKFSITVAPRDEVVQCQAGQVLLGQIKPPDCPAFGGACTPERPLGAPMVSSEGACAAYYRFARHQQGCGHDTTG